jgi:hypothetical protein
MAYGLGMDEDALGAAMLERARRDGHIAALPREREYGVAELYRVIPNGLPARFTLADIMACARVSDFIAKRVKERWISDGLAVMVSPARNVGGRGGGVAAVYARAR